MDQLKNIQGLHPDLKRKLRAALDAIIADPAVGKSLRDELAGLRSYRIGRFRLVYRVARSVIEIVAVGPRASIYEETWRRVRRDLLAMTGARRLAPRVEPRDAPAGTGSPPA